MTGVSGGSLVCAYVTHMEAGDYSIDVNANKISISGPAGEIVLDAGSLLMEHDAGSTTVRGSLVRLNGGCSAVARRGDAILVDGPDAVGGR